MDEYASEQGCIPGLLAMLQAFISPTYRLLAPKGSLKEHPDTVDDFFRLNARFLQRAPMAYLQTAFIKSILECALLCPGAPGCQRISDEILLRPASRWQNAGRQSRF